VHIRVAVASQTCTPLGTGIIDAPTRRGHVRARRHQTFESTRTRLPPPILISISPLRLAGTGRSTLFAGVEFAGAGCGSLIHAAANRGAIDVVCWLARD
jgi:hypothetical protein